MIRVIPSIASANLLRIEDELKKAERAGSVHLDIEDGNFSPDITFGMDLVRQIASCTSAKLDAHLMVAEPHKYITPLLDCGVRQVAVHLESTEYPSECLELIHSAGGRAGLALNYKTLPENLRPYLDMIDYILLQTGEAGDPVLAFKPFTWEKVRQIKRMKENHEIELWVDGGIKPEMLDELEQSGVDCAVMGRAFFKGEQEGKE